MGNIEEQFAIIENSINWLTKEIEMIHQSKSPNKPLSKEKMLHAINLQNKLNWERKQIEKYE